MRIKEQLQIIIEHLEKQKDRLWTLQDVADYAQYSMSSIYKIKDDPSFPRAITVGGYPRYQPDEIKNWFNKKRA